MATKSILLFGVTDHFEETTGQNREMTHVMKSERVHQHNCVAGRGNAEVGILVTAVAAGASAAVAALADEEETVLVAATGFFAVAKDVATLLAGTDVEIAKDEIFDLTFDAKQQTRLRNARY